MLSGRLAGMAVRPFPLQSTMLLEQVHMAGQEPAAKLQVWRLESDWPASYITSHCKCSMHYIPLQNAIRLHTVALNYRAY